MNDPPAATASFLPFILVRWRSQEQRQSRGNRIGQGGQEAKELQQKQQGADERVLVGWGLVYLALQIAPGAAAGVYLLVLVVPLGAVVVI
jgi:hypothetical protein